MGLSIEEQREKIRKRERVEKEQKEQEYKKDKTFQFGIPGIYFLYFQNKVVYIGESKCVLGRIAQHYKEGVKIFDKYTYRKHDISEKHRKTLEKKLIKQYSPK